MFKSSLVKDEVAISKMREAGRILALVKKAVRAAAKVGTSTKRLDDVAMQVINEHHALAAFKGYQGFPAALCISVNAELIHGIPSAKVILQDGDVLKIDGGVIVEGYYSDSAFTMIVGQAKNVVDEAIIVAAEKAFAAGVAAIKKGARVGDIEAAIGASIAKDGFYTPLAYTGHGIGKNLHEDPHVRNSGIAKTGMLLRNGMTLAIEPMLVQTNQGTRVAKDQWTVIANDNLNTAHYEQTVLINNYRGEILTGEN